MKEKATRNKRILKDRQKGLSYRKLAIKYRLAQTTVVEILRRYKLT